MYFLYFPAWTLTNLRPCVHIDVMLIKKSAGETLYSANRLTGISWEHWALNRLRSAKNAITKHRVQALWRLLWNKLFWLTYFWISFSKGISIADSTASFHYNRQMMTTVKVTMNYLVIWSIYFPFGPLPRIFIFLKPDRRITIEFRFVQWKYTVIIAAITNM